MATAEGVNELERGEKFSHVAAPNIAQLSRVELRILWEREFGFKAPPSFGRDILTLGLAYMQQERRHGGLAKSVAKELDRLLALVLQGETAGGHAVPSTTLPRTGTVLIREWRGTTHHVTVLQNGYLWNGTTYRSLSTIARAITGTHWNGPRFFGLRPNRNSSEKSHGRK
jgi:Protein of unknown function (DUF2924)